MFRKMYIETIIENKISRVEKGPMVLALKINKISIIIL